MNIPDGIPQHLSDLVALNSERLTQADTRLLDVLLQNPLRAALENGKEISTRAGLHPSSAVRLARRLGFEGYPEFRTFLQNSLAGEDEDFDNGAARVAARLLRADEGHLVSSVIDSEIAALEAARNSVDDRQIRKFAETVRDCRKVFIIGTGHAGALAQLLGLRLNRSGYDAVDLTATPNQMREKLMTMTADDVLWLFAFRKLPPLVQDIRTVAADRGAKTLAVTDVRGGRFSPPPDHQITISRGSLGQSQSLVIPMTVANTVILDLAAIDNGRSIRAIEQFDRFREDGPPLSWG
ncbi:MurR/RpiR family transcriptional regulator [Martelella lutilitoris]|uniref:MurR/RpiR family transcriptional regulator n=1 Tax=Martelella lutilitoris TaxID=2583532 RepID=A0A7T7HL05_9HYPH|nr:MurR/RpiR family transcriptional regulator [Martelella lutilitoris]QQM31123.1 MurR/RpiR family transcriptional regulator [Martelella lutilitoris]